MNGSTIAAIASPPGPGARGIVRLSGPAARAIVQAAWTGERPPLRERALATGRIDDGRGTQPCLLLWMPGPRSHTGEDVAELHVPGSPPLLAAVLARVLQLGAEPARPGEFTRRAFQNGRIDLTRAEGVLALVAARNAAEARAAGALLLGGLADRVAALREALDDLRALCEASLDFDAADTGHVDPAELEARALDVLARVHTAQSFESARSRSAGAPRVVLCGAPNAGKSALYNALVGRDDAIVSDVAGTTRDALEADVVLDGQSARLLDMPGFDAAAAGIDRAAQDRARERLAGADLVVWVVDATRSQEELAAERASLPAGVPIVLSWSKTDLAPRAVPPSVDAAGTDAVVATSARTGAGLAELRRVMSEQLERGEGGGQEGESPTLERELTQRHQRGLEIAARELGRALELSRSGAPLDLVAEHLRAATLGLDEIRGTTTPEDLLDRIFARFCLGK